jgi:hypothetical protein
MNLSKIILPLFFLSATVHVHAQEALTASGGGASGIGGSSSYSIGQVFYSNYIGLNGSEAQGVQQASFIAAAGCTDSVASNYDSTAISDDGSCEYLGCTDHLFMEYNPYALTDDGSCSVSVVLGCLYDSADNYNSAANTDDESCVFSGNSCPGDFTLDGYVNVSDLGGFLGAFGTQCE